MANTSPLVPNPWSPHLIQPLGVLASICGVSILPWEAPCQWQWRHQIMLILFLGPSRGAGRDPCDTDLGFENLRHVGAATL